MPASMVALQLRAGWVMAGVTGTYLRYEGAGDQHVGRTVSGLPLDHPDFTVLPPHFPIGNSVVFTAIQILFPGIPSTLTRVAELGLASVVYHWPTLNTLLHPTHLVRNTPLLTVPGLMQSLAPLVTSGYAVFLLPPF